MMSRPARLAAVEQAPFTDEPAGGVSLDIAVVTDAQDFAALHDEWDALFERAADPQQVFQSFVFLSHWARHYLDDRTTLSIIIGRKAGRLVMAWPLVRRRKAGIDTMDFMGAPVAQFGDLLVEKTEDTEVWLRAGWAAVQRLGADLFEARKVRADSAFARCPINDRTIAFDHQKAPFADLTRRVGADGPGNAYSAKERSNHRRHLRRLAERGKIAFHHYLPGSKAAELASQAVALKREWLSRSSILSPTVADQRFETFFRNIAADRENGSPLRISVIECDGKPVGIDLSFDCKGRAFGHVLASDPNYEREGIGAILVHQVFANAHQRGNAVFDLLAPADRYKLQHADGSISVQDILVPLSVRGRLFSGLVLQRLKPLLKTAARLLPTRLLQLAAARFQA
jgi:CelD/BcsL family acetyltransferase involved in cellulose biosynthesis